MVGRRETRHHSMVSAHIFVMENIFRWLFVSPPNRSEKMFSFISFFLFAYLGTSREDLGWAERPSNREDVVEGHFHDFFTFHFVSGPFQSRSVGFYCISSFQISGTWYSNINGHYGQLVGQAKNHIWFELYLCIFGYDSSMAKTKEKKCCQRKKNYSRGRGGHDFWGTLWKIKTVRWWPEKTIITVHLWESLGT